MSRSTVAQSLVRLQAADVSFGEEMAFTREERGGSSILCFDSESSAMARSPSFFLWDIDPKSSLSLTANKDWAFSSIPARSDRAAPNSLSLTKNCRVRLYRVSSSWKAGSVEVP